ncbi:MAG: hypothetical protein EOP11_16960 [Proteobacteria bacterium]|nr:MAG: hypothetical protein EOP11_16960 [Pseudomonadota bacterium]
MHALTLIAALLPSLASAAPSVPPVPPDVRVAQARASVSKFVYHVGKDYNWSEGVSLCELNGQVGIYDVRGSKNGHSFPKNDVVGTCEAELAGQKVLITVEAKVQLSTRGGKYRKFLVASTKIAPLAEPKKVSAISSTTLGTNDEKSVSLVAVMSDPSTFPEDETGAERFYVELELNDTANQ